MESKATISAAIMVYNGLDTIKKCLKSLSFCDEIVVVDDMSTDGTWEFLQTQNIKTVQHKHTTFAEQREYSKNLCNGDWILIIDADEYITENMAVLLKESTNNSNIDGYYLKLKTPFPKGLNGYYFSWHLRFVKTNKCNWVKTDNPHSPLIKSGLRLKQLENCFFEHEALESTASALRKSINRSVIMAEQLKSHGKKRAIWRLFYSTVLRFMKMYIKHGSWRFGRDGIVWSCCYSFEALSKYIFYFSLTKKTELKLTDGGPGSYPESVPHSSPSKKT